MRYQRAEAFASGNTSDVIQDGRRKWKFLLIDRASKGLSILPPCHFLFSWEEYLFVTTSHMLSLLSTDRTQMCYAFVRIPKHLYDENYMID